MNRRAGPDDGFPGSGEREAHLARRRVVNIMHPALYR